MNFEHAWGDGVAVLRYFNEVYKDKKVNAQGCQATMEGVANLDFNLTPNLTSSIEKAKSDVEEQCSNLSTNVMQYQKYGKKDIKKFQMSPDAIMQLAFQVSYTGSFRPRQCFQPHTYNVQSWKMCVGRDALNDAERVCVLVNT